jgi:REP element-mobilizing transposase RayT
MLTAHMIFSTKNRKPFLIPDVQPRIWGYMSRTLQNLECHDITVGGVADHVHILCNLTKKHAPMKVLEILKKDSSKFAKTLDGCKHFQWQDGYGLFSVSPSHIPAVHRYIQNQEAHHRREAFQDELRRILKKYGVSYDERYLWD